ncbi:hypothetical protein JHS3_20150 [Jeongeupia sp. HS-3]|nr:hypothetical protein JHS3_20150 [Jeongeupia sp. HS-3]
MVGKAEVVVAAEVGQPPTIDVDLRTLRPLHDAALPVQVRGATGVEIGGESGERHGGYGEE